MNKEIKNIPHYGNNTIFYKDMKTAVEILNQFPSKKNPFIGADKLVILHEDALLAMKEYANQAINELIKEYHTQSYNAITKGAEFKSIDTVALDFIKKNFPND